LYLQGQINAFEFDSLAVIGSRRPTLAGQKNAIRFSRQLAEMGFCITSGLAIGIDTYAHKGAVDAQGVSCAVLGSGLENIYPKQNQKLALAIQERGLIISELALDVNAMPANFPRRNRVISGLSKGVIVVEAGLKSGSLITADFAIEQNREVFAIPGSIDNPLSKGGHALIKQGAVLVDDVNDIVGLLGQQCPGQKLGCPSDQPAKVDYSHLSNDEQRVISVLGSESTSFDDLVHCLGIDVGELNNLLVMLELKGEVSAVVGGYQKI
jgi:DNA processing protein